MTWAVIAMATVSIVGILWQSRRLATALEHEQVEVKRRSMAERALDQAEVELTSASRTAIRLAGERDSARKAAEEAHQKVTAKQMRIDELEVQLATLLQRHPGIAGDIHVDLGGMRSTLSTLLATDHHG